MSDIQEVKIILLGKSGVGKSSIVERFNTNSFDQNQKKISFMEYCSKTIEIDGTKVKLNIYDTNGEERFRAMVKSYYRHAEGALLVYSVVNVASFMQLASWLLDLQNECPNAAILVAGNQNDMPEAKAVFIKSVKDFCVAEGLEFMEMSAKTGDNINRAFHRLGELILMKRFNSPPAVNYLETQKNMSCQTDSSESYANQRENGAFKLKPFQSPPPLRKKSCC